MQVLNSSLQPAWNTRSLTFERFKYCESLRYDVLALTELWRNYEKFCDGTLKWIHGKPELVHGTPRYPDDQAAGVGLLLSRRAQQKCISHGSPCERIVWARIKGPVTNLFVIGVHMPQSSRKKPAQSNTIVALTRLLKEVPRSDCTVIMGDLNVELPANINGVTGKWATATETSKHAEPVIDIMRMFDLVAANTLHQPKKGHSSTTFVQNIKDSSDSSHTNGHTALHCPLVNASSYDHSIATSAVPNTSTTSTTESFLGRKVITKYRGKFIQGTVKFGFKEGGVQRWSISFNDDYQSHFDSTWVKGHLCETCQPQKKRHSQIDYILVSKRWASSIVDTKVSWAPSIHRNIYGKAYHALVWAKWIWKVRAIKGTPGRSWNSLDEPYDQDADIPLQCIQRRPALLPLSSLDNLIAAGEDSEGAAPPEAMSTVEVVHDRDHVRHNPCIGSGLPSSEGKSPGCAHSSGSVWGGDVVHASDTDGYPPVVKGTSHKATDPCHAATGYGDAANLVQPVASSQNAVTVNSVGKNSVHVRHNPCIGSGLPSSEGKSPGCARSFGSVWGGDVVHVTDTDGYPPAVAGKKVAVTNKSHKPKARSESKCKKYGLTSIPGSCITSKETPTLLMGRPPSVSLTATDPYHAAMGYGDAANLETPVLPSHNAATVVKKWENIDLVRHNPCIGSGLPSSEGKSPGCAHSFGNVWGGDVAHVSGAEGYPPAEAGEQLLSATHSSRSLKRKKSGRKSSSKKRGSELATHACIL